MKNDMSLKKVIGIIFLIMFIYAVISSISDSVDTKKWHAEQGKTLNILSSYENHDMEEYLEKYAKKNKLDAKFTYMGDLAIIDELNQKPDKYDAVWISNSMWLYMLNNPSLASKGKSLSISPVIMGIRNKKAKELDLINKEITNEDILNLIKDKKINYVMPSVTATNSGATAYLGFLNSLSGNPEILTEDMINSKELQTSLKELFSGVSRVSGDEEYLEEMFTNTDEYEAIIASEASLISINNRLISEKKEPLYFLYPTDGVAVNDSTFAFIGNNENKKETFLKFQNYLLSNDSQKLLEKEGRRTWYGGISTKADSKVFNKSWGIDTTKYLNTLKFPSKNVITKAINVYIENLRKPGHTVFVLDYSGSMYMEGNRQLTSAMDYILDYDSASKDKLQFSESDTITVITFSSKVSNIWTSPNGKDTKELIGKIKALKPDGGTELYEALIRAEQILNDDTRDVTKTIIAMTDGEISQNSGREFENIAKKSTNVPVYSIMFGSASARQLTQIAQLTNARVFDGRSNLLGAFKEVRGYN